MALVEKWLVQPFAKGLVEPYTLTAILYGIKTILFYSSNRNIVSWAYLAMQHSVFNGVVNHVKTLAKDSR